MLDEAKSENWSCNQLCFPTHSLAALSLPSSYRRSHSYCTSMDSVDIIVALVALAAPAFHAPACGRNKDGNLSKCLAQVEVVLDGRVRHEFAQ